MSEITKQLNKAPPNVILTSGRSQIVNPTMAAFKIRTKIPIVRKIRGNAKIVKIGFTKVLTREKIKPAAAYIQRVSAPGITEPNHVIHIHIATLDMSQRSKNKAICRLIIACLL